MKRIILLVLGIFSFAQMSGIAEDYSKMSADELGEALVTAVERKNQDAVTKLIQAGVSVHQTIHFIEKEGDCDWNVSCDILVYAASKGYENIVVELLKANPKIEAVNRALICAANRSHTENIVRELLKANPEVDAVKEALSGAAKQGYVHIVRDFLELISAADSAGERYLNKVKKFIRAMVNVNFDSKEFLDKALIGTVICFMSPECHSAPCAKSSPKNYLDIIQLLMQEGANVNYVDSFGHTPIIRMLSKNIRAEARNKVWSEILQLLLESGADVNHINDIGYNALTQAIKNHNLDAVQMLLRVSGIDLNLANKYGDTPFIIAINSIRNYYREGNTKEYNDCVNSQEIVKILAQTPGINPHIANKKGDTAITLLEKINQRI